MTQRKIILSALSRSHDCLDQISTLCAEQQCHIEEAQYRVYAGHHAAWYIIDGKWNHLAKLENVLETLAQSEDLSLEWHGSEVEGLEKDALAYTLDVTALSHPNTPTTILEYVFAQKGRIVDCNIYSFAAPHSKATMQTVSMTVLFSNDLTLGNIRESFVLFCDDHNLDGIIEMKRS